MQPRKFRILSAITAGSLALAVVAAITVGSGSGHTAQPAALAAQTESFPPVNLDDCPILHTGYPTGGCVAELQKDLNLIAGNNSLTVDGTFGLVGSQTYNAVIAFQQKYHLSQDGMVGPDTKNALERALSGDSVPTPTLPPAGGATPTPSVTTPTPSITASTPSITASTPSEASVWSKPHLAPAFPDSSIEFNKAQTDYFDSDESKACGLIEAYSLYVPEIGEVVGTVVAGACEAAVKIIEVTAAQAEERGMCLELTFSDPPQPITMWPGIYQGKYCD